MGVEYVGLPDKPKLSFLLETLKKHNEYVSNKIFQSNDLPQGTLETVVSIQREVQEKIGLMENLRGFLFPETYYINRSGEGNLLAILNKREVTGDIVNYFENSNYKREDDKQSLTSLIDSISIINEMTAEDYFRKEDMDKYLRYRRRTYEYTNQEKEALEFIEAPTSLMMNEDVIKPNISERVEQIKKDTERYYFMEVALELLNLYHSHIIKPKKTGLTALVRSM